MCSLSQRHCRVEMELSHRNLLLRHLLLLDIWLAQRMLFSERVSDRQCIVERDLIGFNTSRVVPDTVTSFDLLFKRLL